MYPMQQLLRFMHSIPANKACFLAPLLLYHVPRAGLAQLVEQLICNHQVVSSNPTAGTI